MVRLVEPMHPPVIPKGGFKTLWEFYPFYLGQHLDPVCRRLHLVGSTLVLVILIYAIIKAQPKTLLWCPVAGYFFAWVGHFVFEKNRPATFTYPVYSLISDYIMWYELIFAGRAIDERKK